MDELLKIVFGLSRGAKVLDVGCGSGGLVERLRNAGFDAYGADLPNFLPKKRPPFIVPIDARTTTNSTVSFVIITAYRLPFEDASFDAVVSTSVLEHVKNKPEFFAEVHRVLKPGGLSLNSFPGRHYLPTETHLKVPLIASMWPHIPDFWLALWAVLGVRNEFQRSKDWRTVYRENREFCRDSLSYWTVSEYRQFLLSSGFENFRCGTDDFLEHATGGYAALLRRLRLPSFVRSALRDLRDVTIAAEKTS
ncbi:MAG: class I SAM-dependent methyltransferase [Gammaproteobacteria bacterium]|nr:class I SAM-dependent methyltransferase [Gammaproteobacteria bacterium]